MIEIEFKRKTGKKIKRGENGHKWGSNACADPYFFRGGGGGGGVQLQTRAGPTKFHHFKTHNLENRGGTDPVPLSGSAHEMLFPLCAVVN